METHLTTETMSQVITDTMKTKNEDLRRQVAELQQRAMEAEAESLKQSRIALDLTERSHKHREAIVKARIVLDGLAKELYDANKEIERMRADRDMYFKMLGEVTPERDALRIEVARYRDQDNAKQEKPD